MRTDPRGGHNQNKFNKDFFKSWSPAMAYVFGFIMADGAVEDVRKSSRTCYLHMANNDKDILDQIKTVMDSNHKIYSRPERWQLFKQKHYWCKQSFHLRIGSKEIYQNLIDLGVRPRKSLTMKLPQIPEEFLNYFLRGYFDGDGCVNIYKQRGKKSIIQIVFTSGSKTFLSHLSKLLSFNLSIKLKNIYFTGGAFRLIYKSKSAFEILTFMYKNLCEAPYLKYKYLKFIRFRQD